MKLSLSQKGRPKNFSEETKQRMSDRMRGKPSQNLGKPVPIEVREKISRKLKGRKLPAETCKKMSASRMGEKHYLYGRHPSEAALKKMSEAQRGEKSARWKGGISFEPYCVKFNNEFKERVRAFFGYQCVECSNLQGRIRLSIHHVNFDKMSCCDGSSPFVLCLTLPIMSCKNQLEPGVLGKTFYKNYQCALWWEVLLTKK